MQEHWDGGLFLLHTAFSQGFSFLTDWVLHQSVMLCLFYSSPNLCLLQIPFGIALGQKQAASSTGALDILGSKTATCTNAGRLSLLPWQKCVITSLWQLPGVSPQFPELPIVRSTIHHCHVSNLLDGLSWPWDQGASSSVPRALGFSAVSPFAQGASSFCFFLLQPEPLSLFAFGSMLACLSRDISL